MKQLRPAILLLVILMAGTEAMAQKEIVFGSENHSSRSRNSRHRHRGGDAKNAVYIGLVSFINGYTPVYYERAITNTLSVQVGAGVTTRSYTSVFSVLGTEGNNSDNFKGADYDIPDDYDQYKYRKAAPGLYLSVAPKIYYAGDGMEGAYISPMLEFKQYRWNARMADESVPPSSYYSDIDVPRTTATQAEYMRCLDLSINFGGLYQTENHIVFSWSTGIGVRNAHSSRLDVGVRSDGLGLGNERYANAVQEYDKTKLLFSFQFAIGGWY